MSTRSWGTNYNGKGNADSIGHPIWKSNLGVVQEERYCGSYTWTRIRKSTQLETDNMSSKHVHVEEYAGSFCGHFSKPSWCCVFEIRLSLGDRFWRDNMMHDISLDDLRYANLQLIGVETRHSMPIGMVIFVI
jgi:hypothetical protein